MIVQTARKVRTSDPSAFARAGLRRFQNVDLVANRLAELHGVPPQMARPRKKASTTASLLLDSSARIFQRRWVCVNRDQAESFVLRNNESRTGRDTL